MIFDRKLLKNCVVYRIAYSSIACIYTNILRKLYNAPAVRFFPHKVSKKRIFFSCYLFNFNYINNLLEKTQKNSKNESAGYRESGKQGVYQVYLYSSIAIYNPKIERTA